jgi:hypothetical protein
MTGQQTDDETTSLPQTRAQFLELFRRAQSDLDEAIAAVDSDRMVMPGPDGGWSPKDHVAHLATWNGVIAALLRNDPGSGAAERVQEAFSRLDLDRVNATIFERNKDRILSEVLLSFRLSHEELLDALAGLTDANLFEAGSAGLEFIAEVTYGHYACHLNAIRSISTR